MAFIKPYFAYSNNTGYLFPDVGVEDYREIDSVERYDHISASGKKISYKVGAGRDFLQATFPWQSDAMLVLWQTFWAAVEGGEEFYYHTDGSIPICGTGLICSSAVICGKPTSGGTDTTTAVTIEGDTFEPEPNPDVDGYWTVTLRMRKVV